VSLFKEQSCTLGCAMLLPFERCRTLLALGQVLRRRNERCAARSALEEAPTTFARLGVRRGPTMFAVSGRVFRYVAHPPA
jgi:hypothetical protein